MSDVPEGYRMSAVGVVPDEWKVKTFWDVMTGFSSGATPYRGRPEYYKGNIRWITSGELNYNVITDTIEKITENAVRDTNLKIHPKGTFLMAITGLEAEGTRGSCGIVGAESTTNQSCMALFPTTELLTEYLFHYYVNYGNSLALEYCQGTKQQSYTAKIVKILPIIVPPTIEEQQAIASALSDVDALITALGQLITKKRNIKQGAMQQLLTGEKRLPGFGGAREVKKLEDVSEIIMGQSPAGNSYNQNAIGIALINGPTEFTEKYPIKIQWTSLPTKLCKEGDILLCIRGSSTGRMNISNDGYCIGRGIAAIRAKENSDGSFLEFQVQNAVKNILALTTGSTFPNIDGKSLKNIEVVRPPLPEQQAIAQILSDMDTEIEALKQKQAKYKAIKQGMMQDLLTGKTRLV